MTVPASLKLIYIVIKVTFTSLIRLLSFFEFFFAHITGNNVNFCGSNSWTLILCSQLNALCSGVCALVELTWQELYSENMVVCSKFRQVVVDIVNLWLREDAQW